MQIVPVLKKVAVLSLGVLLFWGSGSICALQAEEIETRRILFLNSFKKGLPWEIIIDKNLRATLASQSTFNIDLITEYTDRQKNPDDAYLRKLIDIYRHKYSDSAIDLLIGFGDEAVDILLDYGDELFPQTPMVFVTAKRQFQPRDYPKPNTAWLFWGVDIKASVDLIGEILPRTRHVFFVAGTSKNDRAVLKLAQMSVRGQPQGFAIHYLTDMTIEELIRRAAQLPEHSALLFLTFNRDAEGKIPRMDIFSAFTKQANGPVFGITDGVLGYGIAGGSLVSAEFQAKRCAQVALGILEGRTPEEIDPEHIPNILMFDWRQLKRWDISEDKLPAGSVMRYREFSIWNRYQWYILGITTFCLFESLLIVGLLFQDKRRRQAEQKVRESEVRYRTVADFTYDWEYWSSLDGIMLYVSPSCERISGYLARQFMEQPSFFNEIILPQDKSAWDAHRRDARKEMKPRDIQFRIRTKDGEIRWIDHICQPVYDDQGNPLGFRASNRDITDHKRADESIQEMEKKSQSLRDELNHMSRVLSMGEIAASLAHEINQPLTAIRSYAQAAQRLLARDAPDLREAGKILEGIVTGNRRAEEVIQRIRTLMKNEQSERSLLDVKTFIEEVVSLLRRNIEDHKISLRLDLDAELPQVFGDRVQLQQVVLNLILNGLEAINAGGNGLRELVVRAWKDESDVVTISVQDSGIGIHEENEDRIFDAFFSTKSQGMGMGLSISRSIIEEHGGRMWVTSNPTRGTTFSFTVPIHKEDLR